MTPNEIPDTNDVPGHGRPGGIDDPVSDAEYGDSREDVRQIAIDAAGFDPRERCDHERVVDAEVVGESAKHGCFEVEARCESCGVTMYNEITADDLEPLL